MDEVMDVLPESLRKKYQLDRSNPAANQVALEMDTNTGRLTLKIPNLMLSSMDLGGVKAGRTSLAGVVLTVDNAGGVAHDYAAKKAGNWAADKILARKIRNLASIPTPRSKSPGRLPAMSPARGA